MSDFYKCKPSEIIHLEDEYTAFCFDEACMFISLKMQGGETPTFHKEEKQDRPKKKRGMTPLQVYSKFDKKE